MSTRTIIIAVVVLLAIAGGAAVIMKQKAAPTQQPTPATDDQKVQGQDVSIGTGAEATPGSMVAVMYEGKLENGTTFDSSAMNGNQPLVFKLGQDGIIPGFQMGVAGMKEGGVRIIAIPAQLAYGTQEIKGKDGKVIIPANSKLIFQLQLVKVQEAGAENAASSTPTATQKPAATAAPAKN